MALLLSATLFTFIAISTISPELDAATERNAIYLSLIGYGLQAIIEGTVTVMLISFSNSHFETLTEENRG